MLAFPQVCQPSALAERPCGQQFPQGSQRLRQRRAWSWRGQCLRQSSQQRWTAGRRRRAVGRVAASAVPYGSSAAPHQSQSADLLAGVEELLQSGLQSAVSGLQSAEELLQNGSQQLQRAVSGLPGADELLQSAVSGLPGAEELLLSAFGGVQQVEDTHQPLTKIAQAGAKIADALAPGAHAVLGPLDVFGGAWLLDLLFWGILLTLSYSLIVLAPRQ